MLENNLYSQNLPIGPLRPVSINDRIDAIDVLRGFAILGVLIAYAVWNLGSPPAETFTTPDKITNLILGILVNSKAYTLLAFLFGLGFSIQSARARERGESIVPVFCRRLLAMMLIGFAHALLLRNGDILVPYATMGFVLLLFRNASDRVLFGGAAVGAFLPLIALWLWEMSGFPFPLRPETEGMNHFAANFAWMKYWYASAITFWPEIIPMFLCGLFVGRKRILENISAHRKGLRRLVFIGLAVGLGVFVGRLAFLSLIPPIESPGDPAGLLLIFTWHVHAWGLAAFYAASILLLLRKPRFHSMSATLAAVGRMSLTNYLLQSMIIVPICIVFDLYDKITPGFGLLLALMVALVQIPLSVFWLNYFRFGPAEWLWRSITYMQLQPIMRVSANVVPQSVLGTVE